MALDDAPALRPQRPGRRHVLLLLELEDLPADDAGHGHPVQQPEGDEHGDNIGTQDGHQVLQRPVAGVLELFQRRLQRGREQQDDQHLRYGVDQLHDPLHDRVHHAAAVAGDGAVQRADHQHQQGRAHAYDNGHPGAHHHTHHDVTPLLVGAEHVGEHVLPGGLALQFLHRVAERLGLDAQRLHGVGLGDLLGGLPLAHIGLSADLGLLHTGEGLARRRRFRAGLLHRLVRGQLARAVVLLQVIADPLLVFQAVVPRMQRLGAAHLLLVGVRNHHRADECKQGDDHHDAQSHHGHCVLPQPPPGVRPIGHALPVLNKVLPLLGGCRLEGVAGQLVPRQDVLDIRLEGAEGPPVCTPDPPAGSSR